MKPGPGQRLRQQVFGGVPTDLVSQPPGELRGVSGADLDEGVRVASRMAEQLSVGNHHPSIAPSTVGVPAPFPRIPRGGMA
jgi:hypothetical protein